MLLGGCARRKDSKAPECTFRMCAQQGGIALRGIIAAVLWPRSAELLISNKLRNSCELGGALPLVRPSH